MLCFQFSRRLLLINLLPRHLLSRSPHPGCCSRGRAEGGVADFAVVHPPELNPATTPHQLLPGTFYRQSGRLSGPFGFSSFQPAPNSNLWPAACAVHDTVTFSSIRLVVPQCRPQLESRLWPGSGPRTGSSWNRVANLLSSSRAMTVSRSTYVAQAFSDPRPLASSRLPCRDLS